MITLGNFSRELRLLEPHDSRLPLDIRLKFHSPREAVGFLRRSVGDDFQRMSLRAALARMDGQAYNLADEELLNRLALHIVSGSLRVVRRVNQAQRTTGGGSGAASGAVSGAPAFTTEPSQMEKKPPPTKLESQQPRRAVTRQLTWVGIELVDIAGKPVPGIRYRIELPDGQFQEGFLDEDGRARADEIDPGTCWICFPDYDKETITRG